jgi:hypothetical protein
MPFTLDAVPIPAHAAAADTVLAVNPGLAPM